MTIVINGVSLEADFMDADFMDRYEKAANRLRADAAAAKEKKYETVAQGYRDQCAAVERYFDTLFGGGTAEKIFEGCRGHLMKHLQAVEALTSAGTAQKKELNDYTNRYLQRQANRGAYPGKRRKH